MTRLVQGRIFRFPERWQLRNGFTVLYRYNREFPLTVGTLLFADGSACETPAHAGLASFTMSLLTQGTRKHSARQFSRLVESMGGSLGADASEDYSDAAFSGPAEHGPRLLELTADSLASPSFSPVELSKEKAHTLASLRSRHDTIFNVAYDQLNAALFGPDHPYGRLIEGTPESVRRFTRVDCQRWHRQHLNPRGAILSIVSAQPTQEAARWIEGAFGHWNPARLAPSSRPRSDGLLKKSRKIHLVAPFEQAYLMMGCRAPSTHDPLFLATKLFTIAVGGGMSSRLFLELREKLGLAYEVSAFFPTRLQTSQWVAYLGLPPERLALAQSRLAALLDTVMNRGISAAELEQVKRMLKGAYWMEHQTRRRQSWYAAWWEFLGRAPVYDGQYLERIDAVTLAEVRQAGRALAAQPWVTVDVQPK